MRNNAHQVSNVVREVCSFKNGQIKTNNMGFKRCPCVPHFLGGAAAFG